MFKHHSESMYAVYTLYIFIGAMVRTNQAKLGVEDPCKCASEENIAEYTQRDIFTYADILSDDRDMKHLEERFNYFMAQQIDMAAIIRSVQSKG